MTKEEQITKFRQEYLKLRQALDVKHNFNDASLLVSCLIDVMSKEIVNLAMLQTRSMPNATLQTFRDNVNHLFEVAMESATGNTRDYGEMVTEQLVELAEKKTKYRSDLN